MLDPRRLRAIAREQSLQGVAMTERRAWGSVRRLPTRTRLPSERYRASYFGPDGQRYQGPTAFTTKDDASAWLEAEQKKISAGTWEPARPYPLAVRSTGGDDRPRLIETLTMKAG
jgi:hypothetical protein